jgi:hypothetical protein
MLAIYGPREQQGSHSGVHELSEKFWGSHLVCNMCGLTSNNVDSSTWVSGTCRERAEYNRKRDAVPL